MARTSILFVALFHFIAGFCFAADAYKQSISDVAPSKQSWGMTDTELYLIPNTKKANSKQLKFTKSQFQKSGGPALSDSAKYHHHQIKTGGKKGSLYLLVHIEQAGQNKVYVAKTDDYGAKWSVSEVAGKKAPEVKSTPANEGAVDLGALDNTPEPAKSTSPENPAAVNPHAGTGTAPVFKALFDTLLYVQPGRQVLTFDSFHNFLLIDYIPRPEVQFSFDLGGRYFQLELEPFQNFNLRVGKIWIPFDDMNPHNVFGGFINTSRTAPAGGYPFLPDIWTEYGVGVKYTGETKIFSQLFSLELQGYIVNGFGSTSVGADTIYPNFGSSGTTDNNGDKALGGRIKLGFKKVLTFGGSLYSARYSNETDTNQRLLLYGLDFQYRPSSDFYVKGGYFGGNISIPNGNFNRVGLYAEVKKVFGNNGYFAALRCGQQQPDNRTATFSDLATVGLRAGKESHWYQIYAQFTHDFHTSALKTNYDFAALRLVLMF